MIEREGGVAWLFALEREIQKDETKQNVSGVWHGDSRRESAFRFVFRRKEGAQGAEICTLHPPFFR